MIIMNVVWPILSKLNLYILCKFEILRQIRQWTVMFVRM